MSHVRLLGHAWGRQVADGGVGGAGRVVWRVFGAASRRVADVGMGRSLGGVMVTGGAVILYAPIHPRLGPAGGDGGVGGAGGVVWRVFGATSRRVADVGMGRSLGGVMVVGRAISHMRLVLALG